jgi:hypothetical protein
VAAATAAAFILAGAPKLLCNPSSSIPPPIFYKQIPKDGLTPVVSGALQIPLTPPIFPRPIVIHPTRHWQLLLTGTRPISTSPSAIMAQDSDISKSTDKGKGKAVDAETINDAKKGKDGQVNGKKDDDKTIDGEAHHAEHAPARLQY